MIDCVDIVKDYHIGAKKHRRVLNKINFTLGRGEKLGILGRNGAGKSTLIKIIGGVEIATAGQVRRSMSVSWPLAFTGGFQGSLTGLDNLRFVSRIYGIDYAEMRDFVDDFAELGRQIAQPVKTYSSGMRARLAFALSLAIEFDCYLIDEVMLVGDQRFHERCRVELFEKRNDRAMIIISHHMGIIREMCTRTALIHDGRMLCYEGIEPGIEAYEALMTVAPLEAVSAEAAA
jgi:capsular polysaccharide transport system ATP-binding protein